MESFGIQLEYRPITEEDRKYDDFAYFEFDDIDWGLTDYSLFGKNTYPGEWHNDTMGFTDFYCQYLQDELDEYVWQEIDEYIKNKNYDKIADKKVQVPVIVSAWWESDVDYESGFDEGHYEFKFENIMDL